MASIKSNENEFRGQVLSWLNEFLSSGNYPFDSATSDPSIKVSDKKTRFPDIQIWINREAQQGFCGWELKTPITKVDDPNLLDNAVEKARAMNALWFVTWNMQDTIIWTMPKPGEPISSLQRYKEYPSIYDINKPDDAWSEPNKNRLKDRAKEILTDLATLYHEGHLYKYDTDPTYFVGRLGKAVTALFPHVKKVFIDRVARDTKFRQYLHAWANRQGIANYADSNFYETVARQIVYRLLARILFYLTLRRQWSMLPKLDITGQTGSSAIKTITETFAQARQIDWQAVFEEDLLDSVPFPEDAVNELDNLIQDLNRYNFSGMPQDVIGSVFENLIPHEERHTLGQYYTRENLVDLILAFCLRSTNDYILDPTCGTGTFLIRAYDRLKFLRQIEHKTLLSQIWGFDIAQFPSALATINLFRQNLNDYDNFPKIQCLDFFKVREGLSYSFPPPTEGSDPNQKIDVKIPYFDSAVGNLPYIRQELIEKTNPKNKLYLEETLKKEWLSEYPDLFEISKNDLELHKEGKKIDLTKVGFKLSGQADIYAYLFFHTARFIKEGGRMGFVTSNSWLDVGYGYELQKFILANFKLIAILESRCEPWFEDAAVNTIVIIAERCSCKEDRDNHIAKFVKIKKRLHDLIPFDMKLDANRRWSCLDFLIDKIEKKGHEHNKMIDGTIINTLVDIASYEDEDFRVRCLKQEELTQQLIKEERTAKWGQYLRAPQIYFDILKEHNDIFVPLSVVAEINFGIKTGINEFFYLTDEKIKHWGIEEEFLRNILTSPKEVEHLYIEPKNLKYKTFFCHKDKETLQKEGKINALRYIEWGESQITSDGVYWHKVPSVKSRKLWWDLGDRQPGNFMINRFIGERFFIPQNSKEVLLGDVVFEGKYRNDKYNKIGCVLINNTFVALSAELNGRLNLGDGLLTTYGPEIERFVIPNPSIISGTQYEDKIINTFNKLAKRNLFSIFEEVKLKDRQKLDSLVFEAIGLDPDKYLKPIYEGLTELVRERIELAAMRKKVKKVKTERDIEKLMKQVIESVLPFGIKIFPDEFLKRKLKQEGCQNVSIPVESLKLGEYFFGNHEVIGDSGFNHSARSTEEAFYIIYSQKPNTYVISVPKNPVIISEAVKLYRLYLEKVKTDLFKELFSRTFDHKLADSLTKRIMENLNLPKL